MQQDEKTKIDAMLEEIRGVIRKHVGHDTGTSVTLEKSTGWQKMRISIKIRDVSDLKIDIQHLP